MGGIVFGISCSFEASNHKSSTYVMTKLHPGKKSSEIKNLRRNSSQDGVHEVKRTGKKKIYMDVNLMVMLMSCCCCCIINTVQALPFPAPNLHNCLTLEECCTPILSTTKPRKFDFQTHLPMRVRPAAQLVDDAYIAKYQRAVELMKALPDTDGRSSTNQWKLHCLYCNNHLYFESATHPYPLEIHKSWLFFPWHRLYLYFHERILANLINDDTFALPFWNWDNQSPELPQGNVVPRVYAENRTLYTDHINKTSSLYDETRNPCALLPGGFVNFQIPIACPGGENATEIRAMNAHAMYVTMVGMAVTAPLFHGWAYGLGDLGGGGAGALEVGPHASVHTWVNVRKMGTFRDSAADPIFFGIHANIDRLWEIWKTLIISNTTHKRDLSDPDYLNTEFTFYDENDDVVTVSVAQALQLDSLRYKYQEVANPWLSNGAVQGTSYPNWKRCSRKRSRGELATSTAPLHAPVNVTTTGPITFKVQRNLTRNSSPSENGDSEEEMLEVTANIDHSASFRIWAFAFYPEARTGASLGCAEFLGGTANIGHVGASPNLRPEFVWRLGTRKQLEFMGRGSAEFVVVTLIGSDGNQQNVTVTGARVVYSME